MSKARGVALVLALATAGCGTNGQDGKPPDAAIPSDASRPPSDAGRDAAGAISDGSMTLVDASQIPDLTTPPDLNDCPIYDPQNMSDPSGMQCTVANERCDYDTAYCYCSDVWHCCVTKPPSKCPLAQPTPGEACCNNFMTPICEYDCINGMAPDCKCQNNKWVCTISAC
jgi:hypothetical protein